MREAAYPLDIAADMLECQQKKIMTEWAKGNIQIVLDFGEEFSEYGEISAPATTDYFPEELLNPGQVEDFISTFLGKPSTFVEHIPGFHHDYSQSGFYYEGSTDGVGPPTKRVSEDGKPDTQQISARLCGYWAVPYEEFSRLHIQQSFKLKPHSHNPALSAVTLTCKRAPEKKLLRITKTDMQIMRELLAKQQSRRPTAPPSEPTAPEVHGNIERFALERERVLAAALYVAHHYKPEIGKSFKSHAQCIHNYSFLFWPDDKHRPEPERLAKILADAARRPEEWKILGGKAKEK